MLEPSEPQQFIEPLVREVSRLRVALLCLGGMVVVLAVALIFVVSKYKDLENPSVASSEPPVQDITPLTAPNGLESKPIEHKPSQKASVPLGYQTVTISLADQEQHEGLVKPKSKANVVWSYEENGLEKLTTIVRNVRVLSIFDDEKDGSAIRKATLLIRDDDSQIVTLAKDLGKLTLAPATDFNFLLASEKGAAKKKQNTPTPKIVAEDSPNALASLEMLDSNSGEMLSFKLVDGSWKKIEDEPEDLNLPRTVSSFQPATTEMRWNPVGLIIKDE